MLNNNGFFVVFLLKRSQFRFCIGFLGVRTDDDVECCRFGRVLFDFGISGFAPIAVVPVVAVEAAFVIGVFI